MDTGTLNAMNEGMYPSLQMMLEAIAPRPPAPQAKFRILDQATAAEIARARRDYSSHLLLGLLYARAGLLDEAEQELGALQKANRDVAIVRRLLANVRALRR